MKSCKRCNLNFPDSLKFCEACGGALGEVPSPKCPACGAAAQPGWKFCVKCRSPLAIEGGNGPSATERQAGQPHVANVPSSMHVTAPLPDELVPQPRQDGKAPEPQIRVRCRSCKKLVDEDSEFCEFCGASMFEDTVTTLAHPPAPPPPARPQNSPPTNTADRDHVSYRPAPPPTSYSPAPVSPVPVHAPDKTPPSLSMLSSYGTPDDTPTASFRWWHGLILLMVVLLFGGGIAAAGWWWWSSRSSTTQSNAGPSSSASPTSGSISEVKNNSANASADDELKALRDRRVKAQPSDGPEIVAAVEEAEKKFSTDYRFSYERAKLSIKGVISHHEAFEALFAAAEKAIDNGKAQQMLNDLMSDKDGDFYKASRGHHEWERLVDALNDNDKTHLKTGRH